MNTATYLGLLKKTFLRSSKATSSKTPKATTALTWWTYNDLLLRTYFEIGRTGDYTLLIRTGEATLDECYVKWEEIIKESSKAVGNMEYMTYVDELKALNHLLNEFTIVRAMLMQLLFVVDDPTIEELRKRGYKIDTSGKNAYATSVANALQNSNAMTTRINMKYKKLVAISKRTGETQNVITYDKVVADLVFALGFQVDESNLTVGRYNEYKKLIEQKAKAQARKK